MLAGFHDCVIENFHQDPQDRAENLIVSHGGNRSIQNQFKPSRSRVLRLMQNPANTLFIILLAQTIIEQTATNIQNVYQPEQSVFLNGSDLFVYPRLSKNFSDVHLDEPRLFRREHRSRFKVSPTRIKFSAGNLLTDQRNFFGIGRSSSDNHDSLYNPVINFSHLKSKHTKQMAPAYELWPNLQDNQNLVGKKKAVGQEQVHCKEALESKHNAPNLSTHSKSGALRNLLPKPVPLLFSSAPSRIVKVRSISGSASDIKQKKRESGDEVGGSDGETGDDSPSELDESDPDSNADTDHPKMGPGAKTNFEVSDNFQPLESYERRQVKGTMVYPPGDSERLYSDALLVYVKDFNEFIEK